MTVMVPEVDMPKGCQKCRFFRKHLFGNGIDYSYSCIYGATNFPMPWIRQETERADDCPLKSVEGLIEKIKNKKIYKGRTAYSDMHDADVDKIHDVALDEAIEALKEY